MILLAALVLGLLVGLARARWQQRPYRAPDLRFIWLALAGAIPGLVGITYATNTGILMASAFVLGFFLLSSGPIGFQYGAEIARPTPEGTSNGLLLLMGQVSGILFIFGMDSFRVGPSGAMSPSLLVMIGLMLLSLGVATQLRESKLLAV